VIALFSKNTQTIAAENLYRKIVVRARDPYFYEDYGVPDSVDGRFEMITLHAFLVLRYLKPPLGGKNAFGQALFDVMFEDMDLSLREMGAGDMGVGKRVKAMVKAFYGRVASYEAGLGTSDDELVKALTRNVYGTTVPNPTQVSLLANYLRSQDAHLACVGPVALENGEFEFSSFSGRNTEKHVL